MKNLIPYSCMFLSYCMCQTTLWYLLTDALCHKLITNRICLCKILAFSLLYAPRSLQDIALKLCIYVIVFFWLCNLRCGGFKESTLSKSDQCQLCSIIHICFNKSYTMVIAIEVFKSPAIASSNFSLYSAKRASSTLPSSLRSAIFFTNFA